MKNNNKDFKTFEIFEVSQKESDKIMEDMINKFRECNTIQEFLKKMNIKKGKDGFKAFVLGKLCSLNNVLNHMSEVSK